MININLAKPPINIITVKAGETVILESCPSDYVFLTDPWSGVVGIISKERAAERSNKIG